MPVQPPALSRDPLPGALPSLDIDGPVCLIPNAPVQRSGGAGGADVHADLIIAGAGAASIEAMRAFRAAGRTAFAVDVLQRVGGRLRTEDWGFSHPVHLGALWLHREETHQEANPLVTIARDGCYELDVPENGGVTFKGRKASPHEMKQLLRLERAIDAEGDTLVPGDRRTVADVLHRLHARGRTAELMGAMLCDLEAGKPPEEVGAFEVCATASDMWLDPIPRKGIAQMMWDRAEGLPIQCGMGVRRIEWSADRVRFHTDSGNVIEGKKGFVNIPLPVLAAGTVEFDPPLPKAYLDAIQKDIKVSKLEKVFIELDGHLPELFKPKKAHGMANFYVAEFPKGNPAMQLVVEDLGRGRSLITALVPESSTVGRDEQGLIDLVLEKLAAHVPDDLNALRRLSTSVHHARATRWAQDEAFLGSWDVTGPGGDLGREILRQPLGALSFIGCATAPPDSVERAGGALLSGRLAAQHALEDLRRP